ncbi:hypothetical protein DFJ77DRAFT_443467 [Powellomyces hirtus]|nr:hypothetical protein DFJ77DRAFT_443467 [Powellomyces hirtus]
MWLTIPDDQEGLLALEKHMGRMRTRGEKQIEGERDAGAPERCRNCSPKFDHFDPDVRLRPLLLLLERASELTLLLLERAKYGNSTTTTLNDNPQFHQNGKAEQYRCVQPAWLRGAGFPKGELNTRKNGDELERKEPFSPAHARGFLLNSLNCGDKPERPLLHTSICLYSISTSNIRVEHRYLSTYTLPRCNTSVTVAHERSLYRFAFLLSALRLWVFGTLRNGTAVDRRMTTPTPPPPPSRTLSRRPHPRAASITNTHILWFDATPAPLTVRPPRATPVDEPRKLSTPVVAKPSQSSITARAPPPPPAPSSSKPARTNLAMVDTTTTPRPSKPTITNTPARHPPSSTPPPKPTPISASSSSSPRFSPIPPTPRASKQPTSRPATTSLLIRPPHSTTHPPAKHTSSTSPPSSSSSPSLSSMRRPSRYPSSRSTPRPHTLLPSPSMAATQRTNATPQPAADTATLKFTVPTSIPTATYNRKTTSTKPIIKTNLPTSNTTTKSGTTTMSRAGGNGSTTTPTTARDVPTTIPTAPDRSVHQTSTSSAGPRRFTGAMVGPPQPTLGQTPTLRPTESSRLEHATDDTRQVAPTLPARPTYAMGIPANVEMTTQRLTTIHPVSQTLSRPLFAGSNFGGSLPPPSPSPTEPWPTGAPRIIPSPPPSPPTHPWPVTSHGPLPPWPTSAPDGYPLLEPPPEPTRDPYAPERSRRIDPPNQPFSVDPQQPLPTEAPGSSEEDGGEEGSSANDRSGGADQRDPNPNAGPEKEGGGGGGPSYPSNPTTDPRRQRITGFATSSQNNDPNTTATDVPADIDMTIMEGARGTDEVPGGDDVPVMDQQPESEDMDMEAANSEDPMPDYPPLEEGGPAGSGGGPSSRIFQKRPAVPVPTTGASGGDRPGRITFGNAGQEEGATLETRPSAPENGDAPLGSTPPEAPPMEVIINPGQTGTAPQVGRTTRPLGVPQPAPNPNPPPGGAVVDVPIPTVPNIPLPLESVTVGAPAPPTTDGTSSPAAGQQKVVAAQSGSIGTVVSNPRLPVPDGDGGATPDAPNRLDQPGDKDGSATDSVTTPATKPTYGKPPVDGKPMTDQPGRNAPSLPAPGAPGPIGPTDETGVPDETPKSDPAESSSKLSSPIMSGIIGAALVFLLAVAVVAVGYRRRKRHHHRHHGPATTTKNARHRSYALFEDDATISSSTVSVKEMTMVSRDRKDNNNDNNDGDKAHDNSTHPPYPLILMTSPTIDTDAFAPAAQPIPQSFTPAYLDFALSALSAPLVPLPSAQQIRTQEQNILDSLDFAIPTRDITDTDAQEDIGPAGAGGVVPPLVQSREEQQPNSTSSTAPPESDSSKDNRMFIARKAYNSLVRSGYMGDSGGQPNTTITDCNSNSTISSAKDSSRGAGVAVSVKEQLDSRHSFSSSSSMYSTLSKALHAFQWRRSDRDHDRHRDQQQQQQQRQRRRRLLISSLSSESSTSTHTSETSTTTATTSVGSDTGTEFSSSKWGGSESCTTETCAIANASPLHAHGHDDTYYRRCRTADDASDVHMRMSSDDENSQNNHPHHGDDYKDHLVEVVVRTGANTNPLTNPFDG